jgi:histidinol phosphatase-like PHP family hydrolase
MFSYRKEPLAEVLQLRGCVVQINADAFFDRKSIKIIRTLAERGFPIILGSDAHNLNERAPDFSPVTKYLSTKKGAPLLPHIQQSSFL